MNKRKISTDRFISAISTHLFNVEELIIGAVMYRSETKINKCQQTNAGRYNKVKLSCTMMGLRTDTGTFFIPIKYFYQIYLKSHFYEVGIPKIYNHFEFDF